MSDPAHRFSPGAAGVLKAIMNVGAEDGPMSWARARFPSATFDELAELCNLIDSNAEEEKYQRYLSRHPGLLAGIHGSNDNTDLAVLFKPAIGSRYYADFAVLQAWQGGSVVHLIEIETAADQLFTRSGRPSRDLSTALTQTEDWRLLIEQAPAYHATEFVRKAQAAPRLNQVQAASNGVRLLGRKRIETLWRAFGGYDQPMFSYTVVIGRWSSLSDQDKRRVLARNRSNSHTKIFTYEQIARLANFRAERGEF